MRSNRWYIMGNDADGWCCGPLDYNNLQTVEAQFATYHEAEVYMGMRELSEGFMKPFVVLAEDVQEAIDLVGDETIRENDMAIGKGYYCRLSAPGYLDCTEWSGPFKTEFEAQEDLVRMYASEFEDE